MKAANLAWIFNIYHSWVSTANSGSKNNRCLDEVLCAVTVKDWEIAPSPSNSDKSWEQRLALSFVFIIEVGPLKTPQTMILSCHWSSWSFHLLIIKRRFLRARCINMQIFLTLEAFLFATRFPRYVKLHLFISSASYHQTLSLQSDWQRMSLRCIPHSFSGLVPCFSTNISDYNSSLLHSIFYGHVYRLYRKTLGWYLAFFGLIRVFVYGN